MILRVVTVLAFLSILVNGAVDRPSCDQQDGDCFIHMVKKGESVSLLCIDYYGYYSPALGNAFKKLNPEITDINLILAGQKLRFHLPVGKEQAIAQSSQPVQAQATVSAAPDTSKDDTLFIKKVNATQGVVTCVAGTAKLFKVGTGKDQNLLVNTVVYPGDIITTASDGRVELIINRESVIRMRENTKMTIETYRNSNESKGKTKIGFSVGTVWTKVKKFKDKISRFELELPTATAGVHGTVYQSAVNTDSSCEVKVYSGEVAVKGSKQKGRAVAGEGASEVAGPDEVEGPHEVDIVTWTKIVRSMQKIMIRKNGSPTEPALFARDSTSDWEKWNEERDSRIAEMFREISE
jgi:hypothetical protein